MNTRLISTLSLAAPVLFALGIRPAAADSADLNRNETVTRTVRFADLDLGSRAGKQALEGRLRFAAGEVCNEILGKHYGHFALNSSCRAALVEQALDKVLANGEHYAGRTAVTNKISEITLAGGPAP
jgi:UrcA family protein